jgi:hypothetical protein
MAHLCHALEITEGPVQVPEAEKPKLGMKN